jgi:hypothetical protein
MRVSTINDILNIIAYMKLAFPNYNPDITSKPCTADVLFDLLEDMPVETLQAAIKTCCSEPGRQFAPSAGEIRGAAINLHMKASGVPAAGEAWQEVLTQIRRHGCRGDITFSNPVVEKAAKCIGLIEIGMTEDIMPVRAHFLKIYADLLNRAISDAAQLPVITEYIESHKLISGEIKQLTDTLRR